MPQVNLIAVLLCGVSSMVLGGLWYSPALFAKKWQDTAGLGDETVRSGNPAIIYGVSFVLSLIAAYIFAMFLGPKMGIVPSIGAGASAGLCWVGASFGINYLFERRSLAHWLITAGYHTIQFTLFGLILGVMH